MERPAKRECLKCGTRFKSAGPANRICPKCNASNLTAYLPRSAPTPGGLSSFGEPTSFDVRKVGDT